ncbi:MAG: chemotaxis protein CheW [Myxococcaceae bacterium]
MRHVVFFVGPDRYALPLDAVREVVVAPPTFTRVPHAGVAVRGVMTLRGRVVPVVELARLLSSAPETATGSKVILLEVTRRDLGLLVTEVEGIEPIEKVERVPSQSSRLVRGVTRVGHEQTHPATVLDPTALDAQVVEAFAGTPG